MERDYIIAYIAFKSNNNNMKKYSYTKNINIFMLGILRKDYILNSKVGT